jgi:hypothetical protein
MKRGWFGPMTGWHVLRVFGVCVLMSPVWFLLSSFPVVFSPEMKGWADGISLFALPSLLGSLAAGALFVLLAKLERGTPHYGFGVLVPAIGAITYCVLSVPAMGGFASPRLVENLGIAFVGALAWFYVVVGIVAIPVGLGHAALMIRAVRGSAEATSNRLPAGDERTLP